MEQVAGFCCAKGFPWIAEMAWEVHACYLLLKRAELSGAWVARLLVDGSGELPCVAAD